MQSPDSRARSHHARALTVLALTALLSGFAPAQFFNCGATCHVVGGNVSDASTGPFLAGHVYLTSSSLTVPTGATLTIGAGAIIKFAGVHQFNVDGTLNVNGSSTQPVIVTAIDDDTGGDHNGNGASTPSPGAWVGFVFSASASGSHVTGLSVRYAGWNASPAIRLTSSNPTFTLCSTVSCSSVGLDLSNNSAPIVASCNFVGGTRPAVNIPLASLAGFTGCTATGQTVYDAPQVLPSLSTGTASITVANTMNGSGVIVSAGNFNVGAGTTLTLGPGVIVKVDGVVAFNVAGTLITNGVPANPTVITSIQDDTMGGDTNRNLAGNAAGAAQWVQLYLAPTAGASQLHSLLVRCAGWNGNGAVRFDACNASATGLRTQLAGSACLDLSNNSYPTFSGCAFDGGTVAARNVRFRALAGFANCTAAGNSSYDAPVLPSPDVAGGETATVSAGNAFNGNGVFVVQGAANVAAGGQLNLGAGVILKVTGVNSFTVAGTLVTTGAGNNPAIMTSINDDASGGDTNKDGAASSAQPGQWVQLYLGGSSSTSTLTALSVRCAGWNSNGTIRLDGSQATLNDVRTALCGGPCIDLSNNSHPTLVGCKFNGGTVAATNVRFDALSGFSGCTATGDSQFDAPFVTSPVLNAGETASVAATNGFNGNGVIVVQGSPSLAAGSQLTLGAGTIVKVTGVSTFSVAGTLITNGTDNAPVVMTSILDDASGGDTNRDGTGSAGGAGQWIQLYLGPTSGSSLMNGLLVRCAGWNSNGTIRFDGSTATLRNSRTALCGGPCVDLSNNSNPHLSFCRLEGGTHAAVNVRLTQLASFQRCSATGNSLSNAPRITSLSVNNGETAVVRAINTFNASGAVHLGGGLTVAAGGTLDVGPGVVFKVEGVVTLNISGTAQWHGSGAEPIVVTSIHDDAFGGDSNVNGGASVPSAGNYVQLLLDGTSSGSLSHVRVRYAGWNSNPAFRCQSSTVAFNAVRVDRSGGDGFRLENASGTTFDNLVAWACAGTGIRFDGPQMLRHATAAGCAGVGIRSGASGTGPGSAINCISSGNGTNYAGFAPTAVTWCDGFGGGVGNIVANPQFVDLTGGDLSLQATSPCVDVADVATAFAVAFDHDEGSRLSDGRLIGSPLPDLGAYELCAYRLVVTGKPWSFGLTSTVVQGPAGTAALAIGAVVPSVPYVPWGFLAIGPLTDVQVLGIIPTNTPFLYTVGDVSMSAGLPFGMQALGVPATNPTLGAFTNLYRGVLDG